jgi:lantibiotic biosynthesis protein
VRLGEQLIESARPRDHGCSWRTIEMPMVDDLTGFSHGASGIALALLELAAVTHDARFRDTAVAGFDYERQHFNAEQENWPDFRIFDDELPGTQRTPSYLTAWCHGAPGIGLTRLRGYEITRDPTMRREAEAALRTTARVIRDTAGTSASYALCHGIFGNSEVLLHAAAAFNDESYRRVAETVALKAAERYLDDDGACPCGVPGGGETPNLMLGLAGIGYHNLRLDDLLQNPPILLVSGKSHSVACA